MQQRSKEKELFRAIGIWFNRRDYEVLSFFGCRLATGVVDWACMWVFVELLGLNDVIIKIAANILVIILNYVASTFIIFGKRRQDESL